VAKTAFDGGEEECIVASQNRSTRLWDLHMELAEEARDRCDWPAAANSLSRLQAIAQSHIKKETEANEQIWRLSPAVDSKRP
jgi:hypothetical protein